MGAPDCETNQFIYRSTVARTEYCGSGGGGSARRNIVERKKEMIRELTQAAWSELASLHAQEKSGTMTRIDDLRFGDDAKDYFWITDEHPRMIMHPYRPEMNGQDLSNYADPAGKKLFVEFANLVREHGDGCAEYLWQKLTGTMFSTS